MDTFPWYNLNESAREENDISVSVNHPNFEVNNTQMNTHFQNEQSSIKANESSAVKIVCEVKPCAFDTRTCVLCGANGDGSPSLEGRLLYCGHNEWIHVNCAFWSDDVYEELDCSLQNVNEAVRRGRTSTCVVCKQLGATVECAARSCNDTFHYVCARTSQCLFSVKKVVYCSAHCGLSLHPSLIRGWDFELQRPLFIDFDRKTTKYIELSKVQFLIGSLNVTNLGTFFPPLSDTEDAIIPSEFVCSRLFWSIAEPWKIIKYTISTSVLMPTPKHMDSTERNFTIDHSLTRDEVEKKFMEIYKWNKDLECPKSKKYTHAAEYKKDSVNITDDDKVVLQVLEHVLELICSKEVEETCDDEPQNTTDLLPPELKDAIFEDLPHDLLDGISMQDIFPKLMSYEDVITVDLKNSDGNDCASSDCLKDAKNVCNENISDVDPDDLKGRKTDLYVTGNDFWLEPKYSIQSIDDFVQTNKIVSNTNGQELKRSKSEVLPGIKKITRTRNNQRSCSLTWSCKLDNSLTSNMKKRKMSCTSKSVADISSNLFMVVDGTNDKGSSGMLQELRLPDGVLMTVGHSTNVDYLSDTVREIKYRLEGNTVLSTDRLKGQSSELEQGKENKCRIWRNNNNKSQSRIVQVDGADDTSSSASDSESTTCEYQTEATTSIMSSRKYVQSPSKTSEEPVKCGRCQCTYRTHSSYKRHLTTCDFITSESDSDVSLTNEKCVNFDELPCVENSPSATLAPVDSKTMENIFVMSTNTAVSNAQSTTTVNSECLESSKFAANTYESNSASQPVVAPSISEHPENVGTENVQEMPKSACIPIAEAVAPNELPMNHIDAEITTTVASACTNVVPVTVSVPNSVQVPTKISLAKMPVVQKPILNKPKNVKPRATKPVNRNKRTPKTMTIKRTDKTINPAGHTTGSVVSNGTSGPTVIIQHLSSPNMMPAYVEAFQHQTGQNLQCIATIVPNEYKPVQIPVPVPTPAPYFTSNSFVPGTFHLQSAESTNLIGLPNGGFSVISGQSHLQPQLQSQPAQIQPQSTVMGTLIQQSRPATAATIQCGVMSTEQLVLGSVPTLETIVTDAPGSMYFSSQPVYYGFETIVQNTVMSSQQFMSTTLPGVLASNSSYSATTQVFQTSKLEPVIDIHGTGYVLVNPSVTQLPAPITVPTPATITSVPSRPNIMTPQQQIFEPPPTTYPVQITSVCDSIVPTIEPVIYSEPVQTNTEQVVPCIRPQVINPLVYKPAESTMTTCVNSFPTATISSNIKEKIVKESKTSSVPSNGTSSSITLPVAPYAAENKIPMNIVTPTPQVTTSSSSQVSRPMNRVLPMQTAPPLRNMKPQPSNGNKILSLEPPGILNKLSETVDKIQESLINNDAESVQSTKANSSDNQLLKLESASLKLVFQKQSQDGIYKISNKYVSKNNMPIQITPLKQNKSRTVETIVNVKKDNVAQNKEALQNNSNKPVDNPSPNIVYKVHSQDGYDYSSTSLTEVWKNVFEAVQSARAAHNMPLLPKNAFNAINGLQLLGLNSNGLRYLIEQLPGAENCVKYKPLCQKKSKLADFKSSDIGQTSRAARCEPYNFTKQPYDMFSWLASKHRNPDYSHHFDTEYASRRSSSINLPMAMRFRQLKETSKHAVGVYRSSIHGRGLFCLRDIECGEMVIEYAGEVIRSTLTDKREKFYNSKGIGCYMFRVDDNFVIDATMKGNAARFINHSCDPNCYSRVLDILGHKHILIFALRKIMQGEELTYDYKFPFEEDKIPCTCGAKRCRKYLN